jgi:hypothetical protein
MAKKILALIVATVAGLAVLLSLLVAVAQGTEATPSRPIRALQLITPTVLAVYPNEAPNNLDVTLVITGADFQAVLSGTSVLTSPNVTLDDFALPTVGWVTSTTLTATVPWGLEPGVYTLTVENPGGEKGTLPNAFTVTEAIGVWTTDGPYGGEIDDLAVSPVTSRTAFAYAHGAGLFRTQDGGDSWHIVFPSNSHLGRVSYGLPPTNTLYHHENEGLWRSGDDGETWEQMYIERVNAFAVNPQNEQCLWIGTDDGEVKLSTNGGSDWISRTTGLPIDISIRRLAINPITPSVLYAALDNGHVYKTINEGMQWITVTDGIPDIAENHSVEALVLNPFAPDIVLFSRERTTGYRSMDSGESWELMSGYSVYDLVFSPYVSGTVYSSSPAVSTDNGATWSSLGEGWQCQRLSLGLDPTSGLPAYLGTEGDGTWRSQDGGQTWKLATDGIAALRIQDLDVSPTRPETVYAVTSGRGAFRSHDAGQSWYQLEGAPPGTVAADPEHPHSAYFAGEGGVFYNPGGGATWVAGGSLTDTAVTAIAVSAISPSVLYAGGWGDEAFHNDQDVGKVFRSTDYSAHWTELNISDPISISTISDIAVHPTNPEIVYLATTCNYCDDKNAEGTPGLGVFRSTDSGEAWEPITSGIGVVPMLALAIDPGNPQTIYASGWLSSEKRATVFVSTNGGDSWTATDLYKNFDWEWVLDLAVDPLPPHTVYAGSEAGVFWSDDNGTTWNRESGGLGFVDVQSLGIGSGDGRTILYVGTVGGVVSSGGATGYDVAIQASDDFIQGGVYQKTIDHRSSPKAVYLPLVLKSK